MSLVDLNIAGAGVGEASIPVAFTKELNPETLKSKLSQSQNSQ